MDYPDTRLPAISDTRRVSPRCWRRHPPGELTGVGYQDGTAIGCPSLELLRKLVSESVAIEWYRWTRRSGHGPAAMATLAVLAVVFIATGFSNAVASAYSRQSLRTTELRTSHAVPALVPAPRLLRQECAVAATRLRFAVPFRGCPFAVGSCDVVPTPVGAATATPCVGREGSTGYLIFTSTSQGSMCPTATPEWTANQLAKCVSKPTSWPMMR